MEEVERKNSLKMLLSARERYDRERKDDWPASKSVEYVFSSHFALCLSNIVMDFELCCSGLSVGEYSYTA